MAASCFITWGGVTSALTAPVAGVAPSATPSTVKTILQVGGSTKQWRVTEWGYMLTTAPTGIVTMELIETGGITATVTAGSISNYNNGPSPVSSNGTGTASTGYNASAEGSITATRLFAMTTDYVGPYFKQQFPLGREPEIIGSNVLRVRMTSTIASLPLCIPYVIWEE